MSRRLEALYVHDERGRIHRVNQWDGGAVPRFHLARTVSGTLCRFRSDLSDALAEALLDYCRGEPLSAPSDAPPAFSEDYLRLLAAHAPVESIGSGPAFRFPATRSFADTGATPIDDTNAHLLERHFSDWLPDVPHRRPFVAVIEDAHAAAVCASVRITASAHEAGVETAHGYRRNGYASRAVAAWATAVRAIGAEPLYSTSWDNEASRSVARALRLEVIGTDFHVT